MSAEHAASSWDALAREAARRREEGDEQVDLVQLLTFTLASTPYAIPVDNPFRDEDMLPLPKDSFMNCSSSSAGPAPFGLIMMSLTWAKPTLP